MRYLTFFLILLFASCFIPREEINSFTQCYDPVQNQIDTLIRIDGYYSGEFSDYPDAGISYMFFKDGSIVTNIRGQQEGIIRGKELYQCRFSKPAWGTYSIKTDTLVPQTLYHYSYAHSGLIESKIKIMNDSTLWLISKEGLSDGSFSRNDSTSDHYVKPLKFIRLEDKPDSTFWFKEKEWFWCNKLKYKEYMKKLKEEKKPY